MKKELVIGLMAAASLGIGGALYADNTGPGNGMGDFTVDNDLSGATIENVNLSNDLSKFHVDDGEFTITVESTAEASQNGEATITSESLTMDAIGITSAGGHGAEFPAGASGHVTGDLDMGDLEQTASGTFTGADGGSIGDNVTSAVTGIHTDLSNSATSTVMVIAGGGYEMVDTAP